MFVKKRCHCEVSAHTGVAIPLLRGKMYRIAPHKMGASTIFGGNRYLVPWGRGIATTSVRAGLAMTGNMDAERQTPIFLITRMGRDEKKNPAGQRGSV